MIFLAKEMLLIQNQKRGFFTGDPQMKSPIISFLQISAEPLAGTGEASPSGPTPWLGADHGMSHAFVLCLECRDVYEKLL